MRRVSLVRNTVNQRCQNCAYFTMLKRRRGYNAEPMGWCAGWEQRTHPYGTCEEFAERPATTDAEIPVEHFGQFTLF